MPVSINGNTGVITGIAVGGLPDGTIDADSLASNAVTSAKLASGVGGKVLQALTNSTRDGVGSLSLSSALTFYDIPNQNLTITPSATNSKILISFHQMGETSNGSNQYYMALKRPGISEARAKFLKTEYEERLSFAMTEDKERASLYITPKMGVI